jgi:hypothetical protein
MHTISYDPVARQQEEIGPHSRYIMKQLNRIAASSSAVSLLFKT